MEDAWVARKVRLRLPDGRDMAYVDTGGPGRPWLLIHGYSDTSRSFQPLLPHLEGIRLVMPDLPGHGGSDGTPAADLDGLARDMAAFCGVHGLSPALVAGHSLGSLVTLSLGLGRYLPPFRAVLIAATARPGAEGLSPLGAIRSFRDPLAADDPFFDAWYRNPLPVDPGFIRHLKREAARMPAAVWKRYLAIIEAADLRSALPGLSLPALAISGSRDPLFPPAHGKQLAALAPGLRLEILEGHGHNPHWEDPARIASLLRAFA